jgi:hypothetical protein
MRVTSAAWADAERKTIRADIDGVTVVFPDEPGNENRKLVEEWIKGGHTINPFPATPGTGDQPSSGESGAQPKEGEAE